MWIKRGALLGNVTSNKNKWRNGCAGACEAGREADGGERESGSNIPTGKGRPAQPTIKKAWRKNQSLVVSHGRILQHFPSKPKLQEGQGWVGVDCGHRGTRSRRGYVLLFAFTPDNIGNLINKVDSLYFLRKEKYLGALMKRGGFFFVTVEPRTREFFSVGCSAAR